MIREGVEPTLLVVGLGNPLMEDDGFGSAVIHALKDQGLPPWMSAEVVPDVLHVRSVWQGQPAVWFVDAVVRQEDPGTIHRVDHETMLELPEHSGSAHHLEFGICLRWLLHAYPELGSVRFRLWGAEPAGVSIRPVLSPAVAAAVAPVVREIQMSAAASQAEGAQGAAFGAAC